MIRLAPARSSGRSWVMSESRVCETTGAPSAAGPGGVRGGDFQQVRVAVVHDPELRPGQERGEPSAHRSATAGEVVDHQAAGGRQLPPDLLDQVARAGGGVGSLAQVEPLGADPDLLDGHAAASVRTADTTDAVVDHPDSDRAPLARGPA